MEKEFNKLVKIIEKLRAPDGCPWDREQTLYSLRDQLIEETFELVEAIDNKDIENIKEELGDLLLHVIMHSVIAAEDNLFTLTDVMKTISEKLIRRHPHVFGGEKTDSVDDVLVNWEKIKSKEKKDRKYILDGIPKGLPSIQKAYKLQEKARKVGFDWESGEDCLRKVEEEFTEFKQAIKLKDVNEIEEEMGDLLFSILNLSRFLNINADSALQKTNEKFKSRFRFIEDELAKNGISFEEASIELLERYWQKAKNTFK
ncbi:nucleoside triphosphate pyrophosphohydrolase [Deferribacterales bacterium Es71-Z0220]|jgi:tetrapyrrole methylase family protein/MazG family protein|uniref:nucleoside triphosphate pyrophosphohydrolase n=1 Tax=Deferrivibrio essentukiensis TaxID=2880922 RepID=UPI001F610A79|nr:nucleoside triphosphate pyrophosphohydrolase [Deferrivibrio essentukiensis]MCB4204843.1 nucleoside triphosphate pyrophosphohydrolase [Deferrivibrio essentukiensis]